MRLASVRIRHLGPFEDTRVPFAHAPADDERDEEPRGAPEAAPRQATLVFGGDGTGKTTLLTALSVTRPGHALPPLPLGREPREQGEAPWVMTEWQLGEDDPTRPHPLVVASPSAVLPGETAEAAATRRREQAVFDRHAQNGRGFVFVAFSGARWFSRTPSMLTSPERTIARYDVRATASFDDPTRADLARETKQVIAYAAIARALAKGQAAHVHLERFDAAMRETLRVLLEPFDCAYVGTSPITLEPELQGGRGRAMGFEALPRPARHLAAFGALALRALFAAYPTSEDPREREGVVAIDDVDLHQDPAVLRALVPLLCRALPGVQWILTTSSTQLAMAASEGELLTLRREGPAGTVEIGEGILH